MDVVSDFSVSYQSETFVWIRVMFCYQLPTSLQNWRALMEQNILFDGSFFNVSVVREITFISKE